MERDTRDGDREGDREGDRDDDRDDGAEVTFAADLEWTATVPGTPIECVECGSPSNSETPYCPQCGAEAPWIERPDTRFDRDHLPLVFTHHVGTAEDLWESFCEGYFGRVVNPGEIEDFPEEFPDMASASGVVCYVVTPDLDLRGPFGDRDAAAECARSVA